MIRAQNLLRRDRIRHAFFDRRGGVSQGVYESLNCGYGSGDAPSKVRANREAAMRKLDAGAGDLSTVRQCHSADAVTVDAPWPLDARPKADAMATDRPGVALGIMTADCGPVLFADSDAGVIGAAHAGWRGALGGVLGATVGAMESLGASRRNIAAALGPCIRQSSYEVGAEFKTEFIRAERGYERYFAPAGRAGHAMFDLAGFIVGQLEALGLASVEDTDVDTYREDAGFFSYRRTTHRGEKDYGRGLSVVMLGDA